jgi:hypothetical protein
MLGEQPDRRPEMWKRLVVLDGVPSLSTERTEIMCCRRPLIITAVVAITAFSLVAAGCGGGGSPEVAKIASSTTAGTPPPQSGGVAFARCMRSHRVSGFPDPNSSGAFDGNTLKQLGHRVGGPQIRAANAACLHLLPNGLVPMAPGYTITEADQLDYLKGAACMRRHGFPDFPDPTFQKNTVTLNIPSRIDTNTPQFRHATATCQKLIPAGLPYSGSS